MVGQCHRSYQHEFDPTPGGSGRQEGLACSGSWGHKESDTTKSLNSNNTKKKKKELFQAVILFIYLQYFKAAPLPELLDFQKKMYSILSYSGKLCHMLSSIKKDMEKNKRRAGDIPAD